MLYTATAFFLLAALLGVYLLSYVVFHKETPKGMVFIHGPLAVIGLIILLVYAILYQPSPIISIILFILAAMGGFMLIIRDILGKTVPPWMALGHGVTALVAFGFLVYFVFAQ